MMPPKKNATKPAPTKEMNEEASTIPSTETAEPPKDETQPTEGDLKPATNGSTTNGTAEEPKAEEVQSNGDVKKGDKATQDPKPSKKRKKEAEPAAPSKASCRSARGATKPEPSKEQLLNFLLSSKAEELVRPEDEQKEINERGDIRTYSSSVMNPFEELMSAMILSRPISHRLSLRSIRTVLNDPYNFTSARAVGNAGKEKRQQAFWNAKTRHKDKTAYYVGMLAGIVLDKYVSTYNKDGTQLIKALSDNDNDVDKTLDSMKQKIEGLSTTGLEIFLRRVQWVWDEGYPYIDGRTRDSLRKMGLTRDAEELQKLVDEHWSKLGTKHLAGGSKAVKKRRAFVVLLERAIGADLEGKIDEVLEAAASS